MRNENEYTSIDNVVIRAVTKKAVLVLIERDEFWIPQSCIFEDDLAEIDVGVVMELNVATWFYDKEIA